ncbi:hypothetical protein [Geoalkalibacter halelectricus]|uniref:hypothetical protein n=1 Tax=Geoalkalibacter halelectricus TaxID=2847045 RepID=UPI003D24BE59
MIVSRKFLVLALASTLALGGCGGGGSSSDPRSDDREVTLSGVVADGYLRNAEVFADCNGNRVWDEGEARGISQEGGFYTLSGVGLDECVIVVNVVAGQTIDEDDPDNFVDRDYTLMAPAGRPDFVSPLSTLVQGHVDAGKGLVEAEELVSTGLGLDDSTSLYLDYIEGENADLHEMAQIVAATFAAYQAGSAELEMSRKEMMERIVELTTQKLEEIKEKTFTPPTENDPVVALGFAPSMLAGKSFVVGEGVGESDLVIILTFNVDGTYTERANDFEAPLTIINGTWVINDQGQLVMNDSFGSTTLSLNGAAAAYFDVQVDLDETAKIYKTDPFASQLLAGKAFDFIGNGLGELTFNTNGTGVMVEAGGPQENFTWAIEGGLLKINNTGYYYLYSGGSESAFKMAGYDQVDQYIGTIEMFEKSE